MTLKQAAERAMQQFPEEDQQIIDGWMQELQRLRDKERLRMNTRFAKAAEQILSAILWFWFAIACCAGDALTAIGLLVVKSLLYKLHEIVTNWKCEKYLSYKQNNDENREKAFAERQSRNSLRSYHIDLARKIKKRKGKFA